MKKYIHEIRDPIHVFVKLDTEERKVLDSRAFQRLRYVHQLAMTYLVYPGATHRRFEHSLGVMELATKVYDTVTRPENIHHDTVREIMPQYNEAEHKYWRRVIRMAALCHDVGHMPFSHAAESELFPEGWDHECMTKSLILSNEMKAIWDAMTPPLRAEDIVKVAIGPNKAGSYEFTDWEAILSEIIVGNTFGVDRIDYLLRDSLHAGVAYGRFDHHRLIDTLRILPKGEDEDSNEPTLGMEIGGIQSAEALLWARYFMYSQVYFHNTRRIYDIHLCDFLKAWLPGGKFSTDPEEYLKLTDNEVTVALRQAACDKTKSGHIHAKRILEHLHFRELYQRNPNDIKVNPAATSLIYDAATQKFGQDNVRRSSYTQKGGSEVFPVLAKDDRILQSVDLSDTLRNVPIVATDYVFIAPDLLGSAKKWLEGNKDKIISPAAESQE